MPRDHRAFRSPHAALIAGALLISACKSTTPRTPANTEAPPFSASAPAANPTGTDTTTPYAFPLVDRVRSGLEVQWWITDDTGGAVGAALFDLADGAAPLPPERARALIDNGVRLVRIPLAKLPDLQARLPTVRTLERTWFGGVTEWKPLFTGLRLFPVSAPRSKDSASPAKPLDPVLLIDGVPERVPPGVLRVIGRAWTAASASPGAAEVLRLEAAVQLQTASRDDAIAALRLKNAGPTSVVEEGRIFGSTSIDAALEPGSVYVLAPESPGVEWKDERTRRRERDQAAQGAAQPTTAGPEISPPRTIGEAMMAVDPTPNAQANADAPTTLRRPLKAILVLIPR